jgi:hypothetical protein
MDRPTLISILYFKSYDENFLESNNGPLIIKDDELMKYNNEENFFKFCFFNFETINDILYNRNEFIEIKDKKLALSKCFYIDLIINGNKEFVNVKYQINLIEEILKDNQMSKKQFRQIIFSKIVLDLIYAFPGLDDYDAKIYEEHFRKISECNIKIIKTNYRELILKEIDDNYILGSSIDKIYVEIIISLIESHKLEDERYMDNAISELELKTINITPLMLQELVKILDISNKNLQRYQISGLDKLFNKNIINFYYILLKYIIKSSTYIYIIPFLFEQRKNIIKIINNKELFQNQNLNNFSISYFNEKIEFIIKTFTDSKYYYIKFQKYFRYSDENEFYPISIDSSSTNRDKAIYNSEQSESEINNDDF